MQYLFVICGVLTSLFVLLILSRKDKALEHWILGLIFLLITVNCAYVFSFFGSNASYYVFIFSELNYAVPLLYGPLFYFYTKTLTTDNFKLTTKERLHFLPFLLFLVVVLSNTLVAKSFLPTEAQHGYPLFKLIVTPIYFFASIYLIRRYHKQYLEEYSYEQEVNLIWLNWIITGAIILWVMAVAGYIYNLNSNNPKILIYDYYTLSFLAIFMFALVFIAIRKTNLFSIQAVSAQPQRFTLPAEPIAIPEEEEVKPVEDIEVELQGDSEILLEAMREEKPYLDPLLSLAKLSDITGIPTYRLSKVLKSTQGSFYDFINKYRVEHFKSMVEAGKAEQYNILAIAMDSGFNSKASFNRVFKKVEGMTPSQFLKKSTSATN